MDDGRGLGEYCAREKPEAVGVRYEGGGETQRTDATSFVRHFRIIATVVSRSGSVHHVLKDNDDGKMFYTLRIPAAPVCNYGQLYSNMYEKSKGKITVLDSYDLHIHPKKERQI